MNKFYTQTLIPMPKGIDYRSIWTEDPYVNTDPSRNDGKTWVLHDTPTEPLWDNNILKIMSIFGPPIIRVFRWNPYSVGLWHIDYNPEKDFTHQFAINWVLEGWGSIQWNSKERLIDLIPESTFENSVLGHGCLVYTTIPHRVVNTEPIHRITISIQFKSPFPMLFDYYSVMKILENNRLVSKDEING
jgi:hypothetical protein